MTHCVRWISYSLTAKSRESIVRKACKLLRIYDDKFTHVAVTGYSSTIIGSIIAQRMRKDIVIVRKDEHEEQRASKLDHEYSTPIKGYVFIDDFVASGKTLKRVITRLGNEGLQAIYTYHQELLPKRFDDFYNLRQIVYPLRPISLNTGKK